MQTKDQRRRKAEKIAEVAAKRSPAEQVVRLDHKLGVGEGAKKERAKLMKRLRS